MEVPKHLILRTILAHFEPCFAPRSRRVRGSSKVGIGGLTKTADHEASGPVAAVGASPLCTGARGARHQLRSR